MIEDFGAFVIECIQFLSSEELSQICFGFLGVGLAFALFYNLSCSQR